MHLPPSCWFGFARARLLGERHNLVPSLTSALDSSQEFQASLQATHSRCWKQSSTSALCQHQAQASVRSRRGGMRARLRDQVQQQPRAAAGKPTSALPGSPDAAPHFILLEACASWLLLCSSPCFPLTSLMAPSQSPLKVAFCSSKPLNVSVPWSLVFATSLGGLIKLYAFKYQLHACNS